MAAGKQSTPWILIRSVFVITFFTLWTAVMLIPLCILGWLRLQRIQYRLGRLWAKAQVWASGVSLDFEHLDRLYRDGPVIIFCNHQSNFDVLALVSSIDLQLRFMAKASLFRIPFFGWAMSGGGHIAVERDDRKKAQASLFAAADKIKAGTSVFIFPEGTRGHLDGTMLPFKKGGFILAKKAGVVIQPVSIWGSNDVFPPDPRFKFPRAFPGTVRGIVHEPIMPEDYKKMSIDKLSNHIFAVIDRPLERMRQISEVLD